MKNTVATILGLTLVVSQAISVNAQVVQNIPNPPKSGEPVSNCVRRVSVPLNQALAKVPANLRDKNKKAIAARNKWVKSVNYCVKEANK